MTRTTLYFARLRRRRHAAASHPAFRLKSSHSSPHHNAADLALRALCSSLGGPSLCHLRHILNTSKAAESLGISAHSANRRPPQARSIRRAFSGHILISEHDLSRWLAINGLWSSVKPLNPCH